MTVRAIIVGCGAVLDRIHGPAIAELVHTRDLSVVAIADPSETNLQRAARSFPTASAFKDFTETADVDADACLILSPPSTHVDVIDQASARGLDVFCEKPLAESHERACTLGTIEPPTFLAVGMLRRQFASWSILKSNLEEFVDLEDFVIRYAEGYPYHWPISSTSAFERPSGVGILGDIGVHVIDTLTWIFGRPTSSFIANDSTERLVETNASVNLTYANGRADVRLSWTEQLPGGCRISSQRGEVWVPPNAASEIYVRRGTSLWASVSTLRGGVSPTPCPDTTRASYLQLSQFLRRDRSVLATLDDAIAVLAILDPTVR